MQNKHDALPSVNGQDVSGIVLDEVLDIISSYKTNPETCKKKLKLTFLDRDSFNANSSIKTAFNIFIRYTDNNHLKHNSITHE
jgi:hypothetical protein